MFVIFQSLQLQAYVKPQQLEDFSVVPLKILIYNRNKLKRRMETLWSSSSGISLRLTKETEQVSETLCCLKFLLVFVCVYQGKVPELWFHQHLLNLLVCISLQLYNWSLSVASTMPQWRADTVAEGNTSCNSVLAGPTV